MAFKDSDGKITIDEVAAGKDIANLNRIAQLLEEAVDRLSEMVSCNQENKGSTAEAIDHDAVALRTKILAVRSTVCQSSELISVTVKKYQAIDENLKNSMI